MHKGVGAKATASAMKYVMRLAIKKPTLRRWGTTELAGVVRMSCSPPCAADHDVLHVLPEATKSAKYL